jgi:hypothetical protein
MDGASRSHTAHPRDNNVNPVAVRGADQRSAVFGPTKLSSPMRWFGASLFRSGMSRQGRLLRAPDPQQSQQAIPPKPDRDHDRGDPAEKKLHDHAAGSGVEIAEDPPQHGHHLLE